MRVIDERKIRVVLESRRDGTRHEVEFDCATNGEPENVVMFDHDGDGHVFPVEYVERVAAAAARLRTKAGDDRFVCPDHGYYEPLPLADDEVRDVTGGCPQCVEEHNAEEVVEKTVDGTWSEKPA